MPSSPLSDFRDSVQLVCSALRITPGDISVRAGYHRGYVADLLDGTEPLTLARSRHLCAVMEAMIDERDALGRAA